MADDYWPSLKDLKTGDERAWEWAFRRLRGIAYNAAARQGLSQEDSADVAIQAIAKLPEKVQEFEAIDEIIRMVSEISKRRAIDLIRKKMAAKRGGGRIDSLDELCEQGIDIPAPNLDLTGTDLEEMILKLENCLRKLSDGKENHGQMLREFLLEEIPTKELARKYGKSEGAFRTLKCRLLKQLRDCLR